MKWNVEFFRLAGTAGGTFRRFIIVRKDICFELKSDFFINNNKKAKWVSLQSQLPNSMRLAMRPQRIIEDHHVTK
jgi:hypothetical protein